MDDFKNLLSLFHDSNDENIRKQAENTINQMQNENKYLFIEMVQNVLNLSDHSDLFLDAICLILARKNLSLSVNDCPLNHLNDNVIYNLIQKSIFFFDHNNPVIRSNAAFLFSEILLNDQVINSKFNTCQIVIQLFKNPSSPIIIEPLFLITNDFCRFFELNGNFLCSIYSSLPNFFQVNDNNIKIFTLKILNTIIPYMAEIMPSEISNIFNIVFILIYDEPFEIFSLKAKSIALKCLKSIIFHFSPLLDDLMQFFLSHELINIVSFIFKFNEETDEANQIKSEFLFAYISLWKTLIKNVEFPHLISPELLLELVLIVLKIAASSNSLICDHDNIEPSNYAVKLLNNIIVTFPEEFIRPYLENYINQNRTSQKFGERETVISCVSFLISYSSDSYNQSIELDSYNIILQSLNDPIARVRQNAAYCSEIFCSKFGLTEHAIDLIKLIINKISDDSEAAFDFAIALKHLIRHFRLDFPFFKESIMTALKFASSLDIGNSSQGYKILSKIILVNNAESPILFFLLEVVFKIIETTQFDEYHFFKFSILITELLYKLKGKLSSQFEYVWSVLSSATLNSNIEKKSLLILPISSLARAEPERFFPYLDLFGEMINNSLNSDDYFRTGCESLKLLIDSYDIFKFSFIQQILQSILNLIQNNNIKASEKQYIIDLLNVIFKTYSSHFSTTLIIYLNRCIEIVKSCAFEINEWEDFGANASYLSFFTTILRIYTSFIESKNVSLCCQSIFHLLSLVCQASKSNFYILDASISALYILCQRFPGQVNHFFTQNMTLELILRQSMSFEEVDHEMINYIIETLNI